MDIDRANLYTRWRKIILQPHDAIFDSFELFYWWALATGYQVSAQLRLKDSGLPYSPENCEWVALDQKPCGDEARERAAGWNKTVNVFRRACGLPPFEEDPEAIILR